MSKIGKGTDEERQMEYTCTEVALSICITQKTGHLINTHVDGDRREMDWWQLI